MRRILHICQRDDPDEGGSIRVCEALVSAQRMAGLDVWILFLYGSRAHLCEAFAPKTICLELRSSREVCTGLVRLARAVKSVAPDMIHSHDGILWPRLAYLFLRTPVITHAHLPIGSFRSFKERVGWALVKHTSDGAIGISEHTRATWIERGFSPNRIKLVPNGVDFDRFVPVTDEEKQKLRRQLHLPEDRRIIVWVGRLQNEAKGLDRVEVVAAGLPNDTTLVVVGQGPDGEALKRQCRQSMDEGRLIMADSTTCPEEFYKAADLFLFTSHQDAFGLVILEAVACNLPVISFPVTKGGGAVALLAIFSVAKLRDQAGAVEIQAAIDEAQGKASTLPALRTKAEQDYAWPALSRQVVAAYESVLEKRKSRS